jgi:hypothetical protein
MREQRCARGAWRTCITLRACITRTLSETNHVLVITITYA